MNNPNVQNVVQNVATNTTNATNRFRGFFQNMGSYFTNKGVTGASADYLESNSIIAKLSFILLILIIFVVLYSFILAIIFYATDKKTSPYLVKGVLNGNDSTTVRQNPNLTDSVYLLRSNNASTGAEFTWSVWLYINDGDSATDKKYSHIFNKGNSEYNGLVDKSKTSFRTDTNGIANVNNAPGVYMLNPTSAGKKIDLRIVMDTHVDVTKKDTPYTYVDVGNVPLQKWFHLCIRLQNIILDTYVNGVLAKRAILNGAPRQNYNDVFVCNNGGFKGKLADLRYFTYALNVFDINTLVWNGFNRSLNKRNPEESVSMSNQWYVKNIGT